MVGLAYRLLVGLLSPLLLSLFAIGGALIWLWRHRETPRRPLVCVTVAYGVLYLVCMPLAAALTSGVLEHWHPRVKGRPTVDALVVLGAGVYPPRTAADVTLPNRDSILRCRCAAELYHLGPACPVLVTGGKTDAEDEPGEAVATVMARELERLGVPVAHILTETQSRNTYENAVYSARLVKQQGWSRIGLVTSATHLLRGEALFRQQGLAAIPLGCDYYEDQLDYGLFLVLPSPHAAEVHRDLVHEVLGLLLGKLRGQL